MTTITIQGNNDVTGKTISHTIDIEDLEDLISLNVIISDLCSNHSILPECEASH